VARRDQESLLHYRDLAPFGTRAHPTEEHFLPLLVALGASEAEDPYSLVRGGMTHGVLSMDSFGFGLSPDALAKAA
jgi:4,5-DOPA dioxygenase extradiol